MTSIHPGSIQARVGAVLAKIELQIEQQDDAGLHNFVQLLIAYCRPYLKDDKTAQKTLETIKPYSQALDVSEAFKLDMQRIEVCLCLLKSKNLYGYSETQVGDADALYDEPLGATA